MRLRLAPLLTPDQVADLRQRLLADDTPWQEGAATAGWHARLVKHNRQLDAACPLHQELAAQLGAALLAHPLVQAAALPERIHSLRFSRSGPGEGYGRHVDNAFMAGGRADLSFTLALTEPDGFEGGALVLESPEGEEALTLPAGHALLYPSTALHRVEPVQRGERLVAIGWIQSRVRSAEQRELLFELDTARRLLFDREGKSESFDLLCRCHANLLRMWGS